eukprot:jgi/Picsp_1/5366/NSC_02727-R1_protein
MVVAGGRLNCGRFKSDTFNSNISVTLRKKRYIYCGGANMNAPGVTNGSNGQAMYSVDGKLQERLPLSVVVSDAVRRWYLEAEKEAQRGDVKAQALLGQMLIEGYGCEADPEKGKKLAEKARRRGYRMQGVYCEI